MSGVVQDLSEGMEMGSQGACNYFCAYAHATTMHVCEVS